MKSTIDKIEIELDDGRFMQVFRNGLIQFEGLNGDLCQTDVGAIERWIRSAYTRQMFSLNLHQLSQ